MPTLNTIALHSLALWRTAQAALGEEWRSRSIYQIVTDRFALPSGSTTQACDSELGQYCNGTWQGIINKLDYVQDMGFDAIWISPVTKQVEGNSADGSAYHGYWQNDIYSVNEHFGTSDDLKNLAAELHSRNMYLMVDVVTNHFAYIGSPDEVNYSSFVPFNDASYFHDYCKNNYNFTDLDNLETCWMGSTNVPLPDLRTEFTNVSSQWNSWIPELISNYSIDGLRIDSVGEVNKDFWSAFQSAAGVYSVGEAFIGGVDLACDYQNYLPGIFNYPTYETLIDAFKNASQTTMPSLGDMITAVQGTCADVSLLGSFSENHDNARFAFINPDMSAAKNVIAFTILQDGIPVIYQGQEQHFSATGSSDGNTPYNREALWLSGYDTTAPLYTHVKALNAIRKQVISDDASFTTTKNTVTYSDFTNLGMQKGSLVTVLTNQGVDATNFTLQIPSSLESTAMTELLTCETLTTADSGNLTVTLTQGLPKVFYPTANIGSLCSGSSSKRDMVRGRWFRY